MESVGARVKVRLLRGARASDGDDDDGRGGGGGDNSAARPAGKKRRRGEGKPEDSRGVQTQWLRGSVEAFRPTTGKHLVVMDIVYGRCVRGNVVMTEAGLMNDEAEDNASSPAPGKETYRQGWLDRRAILIVPCAVRSAGVLCQPWARCVYFDACLCNEASPLMGSRTDWPSGGLESASDPISRCLRWAMWVDLAALVAAGLVQRIEGLPLVCVCRMPQLPDKDPAAAGEPTVCCVRCAQHYHIDCVIDRNTEISDPLRGPEKSSPPSPAASTPNEGAAVAAASAERASRRGSDDEHETHSSAHGRGQLVQRWMCPFCKAHDMARMPDQNQGPEDKDAATAHLRTPPPLSLETVCEWRYWNVPLSQGGKVADDLAVPRGEWVYSVRHLRHLCGAERKYFERLELNAITAQPHHRCTRRGVEVLPCGKGAVDREAKRKRILIGDAGRNFPCTTGGTARLLTAQTWPPAPTERRSGRWKPAGEGRMENIMRRMACETLQALEGADPPARIAATPSGKLVMHSPRGGYLGERKVHLEVEFSAGAFSAAPPLGNHEGGITADGTRYVRKQVGAKGTPSYTCARVRPRSEADRRRSAARPCSLVGFANPESAPIPALYRSEKPSARARDAAAAAAGPGAVRAASSTAALATASSLAGQGRASKAKMSGGSDPGSKRRLQLRGVAEVLSADLSTKHLTLGREKRLRFGKSPIHAWGVFAEEPLGANEFVIEYKGELIRPVLTDLREKQYEARGVPDYMFRIDADVVVDATLRGSLARFINHSCDPNCFTSIINHKGTRKIVIYAKRAIEPGEELSYDYKFPIEKDPALKVPCFCGAPNCRGTMN
ncbi:Histone-lysine N-methyltransferase SETD1B [Hondaea fermentalgiana]|uniref:[histone H3]-lysine(4) N-trimethyltransferase n=1 Tax=Hondaea fermentalgiana TaxID=2315210 RepID=A0A2R5GVJ9_9STRA|nr:Histone-lysine N-methyltransferase SETD1B [Hondaea fermentalgiana]|eukprot:GBG33798.1 Histone-lysine N-methyltransferase SETD1B [Hondaea fermentalgiana]